MIDDKTGVANFDKRAKRVKCIWGSGGVLMFENLLLEQLRMLDLGSIFAKKYISDNLSQWNNS